jgi:hypothetical protein
MVMIGLFVCGKVENRQEVPETGGPRGTPATPVQADSPEPVVPTPGTLPAQVRFGPGSELVENIIDSCSTGWKTKK